MNIIFTLQKTIDATMLLVKLLMQKKPVFFCYFYLFLTHFSFSIAKSPVFGMINSTISGLSTIRSSQSQTRLLRSFDNAQVI